MNDIKKTETEFSPSADALFRNAGSGTALRAADCRFRSFYCHFLLHNDTGDSTVYFTLVPPECSNLGYISLVLPGHAEFGNVVNTYLLVPKLPFGNVLDCCPVSASFYGSDVSSDKSTCAAICYQISVIPAVLCS